MPVVALLDDLTAGSTDVVECVEQPLHVTLDDFAATQRQLRRVNFKLCRLVRDRT